MCIYIYKIQTFRKCSLPLIRQNTFLWLEKHPQVSLIILKLWGEKKKSPKSWFLDFSRWTLNYQLCVLLRGRSCWMSQKKKNNPVFRWFGNKSRTLKVNINIIRWKRWHGVQQCDFLFLFFVQLNFQYGFTTVLLIEKAIFTRGRGVVNCLQYFHFFKCFRASVTAPK